jgi:hypothetical protein
MALEMKLRGGNEGGMECGCEAEEMRSVTGEAS